MEAAILVKGLTSGQKASQLIMSVIDGRNDVPPYFAKQFKDCVPGAILLFRYNVADTPKGFHDFLQKIQNEFEKYGLPVIFAIDHEGGDVYRTGNLTTRLPSQRTIAEGYSPDQARHIYEGAAQELRLLGITMNLAPVAEQGTSYNKDFLGTRVFSDESDRTVTYSIAAIDGINAARILSTVKHFPGNTADDPHNGASRIVINRDAFDADIMTPFGEILKSGPGAVLVSHAIVDCIDPNVPFCLSKDGVNGIVRGTLGYKGLVITDDLSMGAIRSLGLSPAQAAIRAIAAGCDMIMTSDPDIISVKNAIIKEMEGNPSFSRRVEESAERIVRAKLSVGLPVSGLGRKAVSQGMSSAAFQQDLYQTVKRRTERMMEKE